MALGDHTRRLREKLKVGMPVTVEGPHGWFDFDDGMPRQIWVGAGIGITPFVARMKRLAPVPGTSRSTCSTRRRARTCLAGDDAPWGSVRRAAVLVCAPAASGLLPGIEGLQIGKVVKLEGKPQGEHRVQVKIPILARPWACRSHGRDG